MGAIRKEFATIRTQKLYPPVGRCIYCEATDVPLSKEHIIPFGLDGKLVLLKSSCAKCADVTKRFEHTCLRRMFGPLRVRMNFATRRPKDRPTRFSVNRQNRDGTRTCFSVPAKDYPKFLYLPKFDAPGILTGQPPSTLFRYYTWGVGDGVDFDAFAATYGSTELIPDPFYVYQFFQLLAKIAHSYAVAVYGVDGFRPLLLDIIFGRYATPSYLIGGSIKDQLQKEGIRHYIESSRQPLGNITYLVIAIQLFAEIGGPLYKVVAGIYPDPEY